MNRDALTATEAVTGTWEAVAAADGGPAGPLRFSSHFFYGGRADGESDLLAATCQVAGLTVAVDLVLVDGEVRVKRLTIEPPESEPSLPATRTLSRLGLADVQDQLVSELKRPTWLWGLPPEWAQALLSPARRGRRTTPDHEYALWALRYVEALGEDPEHPMKVMDRWFGTLYSRASMAAYVHKARGRGLLTKTTGRRPGGRLTAKANRQLDRVPEEVRSWRP